MSLTVNVINGERTYLLGARGSLKGESWKRVKFLRTIIEAAPPYPLEMADISRDLVTSYCWTRLLSGQYGKKMKGFWTFNLPVKNADYK